jgi:hypothetical protein
VRLDDHVHKTIVGDRLDLGTLRLERGVAVAGRVLEADGSPLRARARLLGWDPARSGSWTAMYGGRTVGFAEPGGEFVLPDRLSAGNSAAWMLAAVSASGVGWAKLTFAAGQTHHDPIEIRLLPGGALDVQVVDPDGVPLPGVRVHATPYFQPIGLAPMWEVSRYGGEPPLREIEALFVRETSADGRVHFVNLPRRDHPSIRDANRDQRAMPATIVTATRAGFVTNTATADPAADGTTALTIVLTAQRRVVFHGTVATSDGERLPGVTVRLNGDDVADVTDAAGRYELPAHTYESERAYFVVEGGDVPMTLPAADIPKTGDRIAHDFVVARRAPVTGRVVDQSGSPVAGVQVLLGIAGDVHFPSQPEATGADGVFTFPDALASHTDLWVWPPAPQTAWRVEGHRTLTRRDGEVITLHRLEGTLVDLTLAIVDGRSTDAVSPTDVEIQRLCGDTRDQQSAQVRPVLAHGAASARQLPSGRYRATVRGPGGLGAVRDFDVPGARAEHQERIELWPAVTVTCTADPSAIPAADLAARSGQTLLVLLDADDERSQAVDAAGVRLDYTPNTGAFRIGGDLTFRLAGVTPNVARRLRVLDDQWFGETWFTATPGADAHVTLRVLPAGRLEFPVPAAWPTGTVGIDVQVDGTWRQVLAELRLDLVHAQRELTLPRPAGDTTWRVRLWPTDGGATVEHTGTARIVAGLKTIVPLDPK